MSGSLNHSPAEIVRRVLIDLSLGTDPSDGGTYPIFVSLEPNKPDNVITLYNTVGIIDARSMVTGEMFEHFGIQVRVRDSKFKDGEDKSRDISVALDETINYNTVTIGSTSYTLYTASRKGSILSLGREVPKSNRHIFVTNATVALEQTS
jgi:hypothetical protein